MTNTEIITETLRSLDLFRRGLSPYHTPGSNATRLAADLLLSIVPAHQIEQLVNVIQRDSKDGYFDELIACLRNPWHIPKWY